MIGRRREKLRIVFALNSISGEEVLRIVVDIMASLGLEPKFFVHGDEIGIKALNKKISAKKAWPSGVVSNGLEFRFGIVTALKHCFILIDEVESVVVAGWDSWVVPFIHRPGFVQAWVSDVEYDYWQNAKDPLEYESVGREYSHLPKKSNGLPPPLEQVEIDTTNNPGRCELRDGYVEAIGATMWLGNPFWKCVGKERRDSLLSKNWPSCQYIGSDIVKLVASKDSFSDETTADKQKYLRSILFS